MTIPATAAPLAVPGNRLALDRLMDNNSVPWPDFLEHAELSDVGLRRSNNQDNFGLVLSSSQESFQRRGHLFMVADGMGAHAAGELASKMAVDTVSLSYFKLPDASPHEALRKAVEEANQKIHSRGVSNPDFKGMGTTTSVLTILPQGAVVSHVGDSRVYRLRGNRLEQLSADHSLVWEMMTAGKMKEQEVPGYIPKNIITRSLGPSEHVQVDLEGPFPLVEGDTFLLCSDGLSGPVPDDELGVIMGAMPPREAVRVLVDLANLRGGPDNITVIIVRVKSLRGQLNGASEPAASRGPLPGPPASPIPWIVMGVLALATAMLALMSQFMAAAVTGALTLAVGLGTLLRNSKPVEVRVTGGMLGRGPHRSLVCPITQESVDKLAGLLGPLREEATRQNWQVDWKRLDALCQSAAAAAARQDYAGAVREYGHALSFMMEEVRNQRQA